MKCKLCDADVELVAVDDSGDEKASVLAYDIVRNMVTERMQEQELTVGTAVSADFLMAERLHLCRTAEGKPFFAGNREFTFSISHTDGMIAVAVCRYDEIGIDIEKIHDVNDKIIERFYTEKEKKEILQSKAPAYAKTLIWTAKEAYGKCIGMGLNSETLRWDTGTEAGFWKESMVYGEYLVTLCRKRG